MLVQDSSILEFAEINMSTFDSHVLQEVGAVLSWVTCRKIAQTSVWPRPFIEHVDTTHAHAYLDTAVSI